MNQINNKKDLLYLTFSIIAVVITILTLLSTYVYVDMTNDYSDLNSIKSKVQNLNNEFNVEKMKGEVLANDYYESSTFYNDTLNEFQSLIANGGLNRATNSNSQQLQIQTLEQQNIQLKNELTKLEAQIK